MLDITTNPTSTITHSSEGVRFEHKDIKNVDVFESMAKFERVPSLADVDGLISTLDNYKAIYNRATNQVVDMRPVPKTYNLVPHEKMFSAHADQFIDHFGNQDITVIDQLFENGKKAHRTIFFDGLKTDVLAGDMVQPRIDIFNSIDMSWAFQVFSGAYRSLCRNTLVFGGQKAFHQKRKHTRNLEPTAITNKANVSLDLFINQRDYMEQLTKQTVDPVKFLTFLERTLCDTSTEQHPERYNTTLQTYLFDIWKEQEEDLGNTAWNAYNVLTHWSTHTMDSPRARKNHRVHDVQRQRADVVRDVLESEDWRVLIAS